MLLCRMEPYHLVNLLTRQLSLKNIQTMKYSYYQNKKQPPCAEVTDEEVANLIRHDEKLAHMTLDIRQHITANDIATADTIKRELPSVTFSARFTGGRRYDKLTEYNGEIVLDLDKKSPEELARISKAVTGNPHTHISFTSPMAPCRNLPKKSATTMRMPTTRLLHSTKSFARRTSTNRAKT